MTVAGAAAVAAAQAKTTVGGQRGVRAMLLLMQRSSCGPLAGASVATAALLDAVYSEAGVQWISVLCKKTTC